MASPSFQKMRIYLHLVPIFGVLPSLWHLYGEPASTDEDLSGANRENTQIVDGQLRNASRLSVTLGIGCISAIALLGAGASTQATQVASLRFLLSSSFVGSGYFLLSVWLILRTAKGQSTRLPGLSQLSRRLP